MEEWRDADHDGDARRPVRTARPGPERTRRPTTSPSGAEPAAGPTALPAAADSRALVRPELQQALASRRALRQAIILHEILGLPKALQRPSNGIASPNDQAAS
jgi:hypothetical protein